MVWSRKIDYCSKNQGVCEHVICQIGRTRVSLIKSINYFVCCSYEFMSCVGLIEEWCRRSKNCLPAPPTCPSVFPRVLGPA